MQLKDKIIARVIINDINPGTPNQKKINTIWKIFLDQVV